MKDWERLQEMSDEELTSIWNAIWELPFDERPDDDWNELVYFEMSDRGLPVR